MSTKTDYTARQQEIDRRLTTDVVVSILTEFAERIVPELLRDQKKRHVTIVFPSTASLLRRIDGSGDGENDKPVVFEFNTLAEERARQPKSNALKHCDGNTQFCVTIATHLPTSLIGMGKDSILTHSMTCLRLPFVV